VAGNLDAEEAAAVLRVVRRVARSKVGAPFSAPVSEQDVPGYRSVIRRPMDLGTIAQRLETGFYASIGALKPTHSIPVPFC
jgi:hypothetical protein